MRFTSANNISIDSENKCWHNTLRHPTDDYHVEFVAGSGENRFRWNLFCSSFTQKELNLLRHFDRSLHVISTQLQLHQYIFFPEWDSVQRTPESSCPPEIWNVRCLRGFMFPMPQAFLYFPPAGLGSELCPVQRCFIRPELELNQNLSKYPLGSCEVENKSVYLVSHFPSFLRHWPCWFHHFQFLKSISCSFCIQSHGVFLFMRTSLLVDCIILSTCPNLLTYIKDSAVWRHSKCAILVQLIRCEIHVTVDYLCKVNVNPCTCRKGDFFGWRCSAKTGSSAAPSRGRN